MRNTLVSGRDLCTDRTVFHMHLGWRGQLGVDGYSLQPAIAHGQQQGAPTGMQRTAHGGIIAERQRAHRLCKLLSICTDHLQSTETNQSKSCQAWKLHWCS